MEKLEQISALVDGQLDASTTDSLVANCPHDPHLMGAWRRYHLIGDALRDGLPEHVGSDLTARVSAALASEPTVLAPQRKAGAVPPRTAIGLAVAASCAAVVLFSANLFNASDTAPQGPDFVAVEQAAETRAAAVAAADTEPVAPAPATATAPVSQPANAYNPYLVRHSEYRANAGMPGMSPYARLIGHQPNNQTR